MTEPNYWLMKSEPDAYSIDTLKNEGVTLWDGIRNYQARNFMRKMNKGDKIFFSKLLAKFKLFKNLGELCTPTFL